MLTFVRLDKIIKPKQVKNNLTQPPRPKKMSTLIARFTRVFGAALTAKIIARKSLKQEPLLAACDAAIHGYFDGANYLQLAHRFNLPAWTIRAAVERHRAAAAHVTSPAPKAAQLVWPVLQS